MLSIYLGIFEHIKAIVFIENSSDIELKIVLFFGFFVFISLRLENLSQSLINFDAKFSHLDSVYFHHVVDAPWCIVLQQLVERVNLF
jgi:hypothetical protein